MHFLPCTITELHWFLWFPVSWTKRFAFVWLLWNRYISSSAAPSVGRWQTSAASPHSGQTSLLKLHTVYIRLQSCSYGCVEFSALVSLRVSPFFFFFVPCRDCAECMTASLQSVFQRILSSAEHRTSQNNPRCVNPGFIWSNLMPSASRKVFSQATAHRYIWTQTMWNLKIRKCRTLARHLMCPTLGFICTTCLIQLILRWTMSEPGCSDFGIGGVCYWIM